MKTIILKNYIGGEFVEPSGHEYLDGYNPSTGAVVMKVPDSGAADIERAVSAAKAAFPQWSRLGSSARADYLERVASAIEARLDEFAAAESQDQGKPVQLARTVDIPRAVANFRFFAGAVRHHEEMATHEPGVLNYSLSQPIGVAGLISPWNLPLYLLTWKIAPAIAVGNTCVAKPSELTSLTASLLADVLSSEAVRLPPGVVNLVYGRGPTAGRALTAHPDVPLISFTGGTATGRLVLDAAAPHFKKVSLELGGKNANVVFDDCDLEKAVQTTVRSSFANQGEICLCGSRVLVHRAVYDAFVSKLADAARKLVVGDPNDPNTHLGALVSAEHREKVESYVRIALEEGGRVLTGGRRPSSLPKPLADGYFFEPTILVDTPPTCRVMQEEIFGPVISVCAFDTDEEAVAIANSVQYGLSASIWTRDLTRAHRVAEALQCGTVWVNCWMQRDLRVPFGGWKHSGIGREGGKYSIDFYTEQKNVCISF